MPSNTASRQDPQRLGAGCPPHGDLSWIVFPAASPDYSSDPLGAGVTRFVLLTLGLVWLFILSMIIIRQEEVDLCWATIKCRLRLNTPRDPKTGETRRRLWLWIIPFIIASIVWDLGFVPYVDSLWFRSSPFLPSLSAIALARFCNRRKS